MAFPCSFCGVAPFLHGLALARHNARYPDGTCQRRYGLPVARPPIPPRAAVANPRQPAMLPVDDEVDHDLQASEEDDAPFSIGRAIWMFIHNCQDGKGMNGNDVARSPFAPHAAAA